MRRFLIALIIIAVLVTAGGWIYQNYFAKAEQPRQEREEVVARLGTLTATVNTTGTILPEKQTALGFKSAGRVAKVLVKEGQTVKAGDVLAQLDTTDLEYAVAQAELSLASAQAQLLRVQRDPAQYDLAAAEASVQSAKAAYSKMLAGPAAEEVRVARANLDQAEVSLKHAQEAYNQVADRPDVEMLPQALQLEQATKVYEVAQANFELTTRGPTGAELAAARSSIAQAEAGLARLQEGVADEDLLIAQLGVEQAQLSLDQARLQLEGASLTAPHDGTITMVSIEEGELSGGQPAFTLTDLSQYHIDASVDEIDIGGIAEDQPVTTTVDALPGEILTGRVDQIATTSQLDSGGVVTYKVTIHLDPSDALLRAGMTANVDIVTERHEDVLLVPNRFIRIDRATGRAFVDKLVGEQVQPVEIQIGLRDETLSEVLAGLGAGDVVVLITQSSREQLRQIMEMGGSP
jgi:HlyD family secretion protein